MYSSSNPYTSSRNDDEQETSRTKIFYASRTHSQLSQVVPELRKLRRFPATTTQSADAIKHGKRDQDDLLLSDLDQDHLSRQSRLVALGSRKQLCINEELISKGGDLDEACRDLLQCGFPRITNLSDISHIRI